MSSSAASVLSEAEAAALLWERAWSLEEVRAGSQGWSLAADAGLLHFLQEFSQQTISRTHEIKKQLDRLIHETKSTDCRLHNVFNGFLMLSNTQFIENRVYDDEVEEPIPRNEQGDKPEQEKTREQKEIDLIPKIQEAVNYGLQVLDSAFEQLDIKAGNSDSEEEANERVELILEPKDLYIERPLPYLIGSQLFMEQDDVGLGDLSSDEGSVDSDRGSMIDSEGKDEEELEEFGDASEDDQRLKVTLISDEEEDLFGDSEKGEEDEECDLEQNLRPKNKRPASFTDELAARIKGATPTKPEEEQLSYPKSKKNVTEKEEVPSDDDDDIFKPPKLTDEDFLPFPSKEGLFGSGLGLFDNDESDLFAELPKGKATVEKETRSPINDEPSSKAVRKVPAGAVSLFPGGNDVFSPSFLLGKEDKKLIEPSTDKAQKFNGSVGLFDDEDFESTNANSISAKPTTGLFDAEQDLFKEKTVPTNIVKNANTDNKELTAGHKSLPSSAENNKPFTQTPSKDQKSLFSDEEDSEDLFSSHQSIKTNNSPLSSSKVTAKTSLSLFDEEDEEDLFGSAPKMQKSKPHQQKATSLLFSSDEEDQWNNAQEVNPASELSQKKKATQPAYSVSQTTKKCLFEEEGEEDIFAITEESKKKSQKAALLFEDGDGDGDGDSLFKFQSSPQSSVMEHAAQEDFLEVPQKKLAEEKAETLDEPDTFHDLEQRDVIEKERKEQPLLEKDTRRKNKSVFSLLEEDERSEDINSNKNTQKEIGKSPENILCSKSTGVFQDEELLFSHKLQKDNDPDVDLFASNKRVSKPRVKLPSAGDIFATDSNDGDDGLFNSSEAKPLANLDINPTVFLPSGTSGMKRFASYPKTPCYEPHSIQHAKIASVVKGNNETGVSFDSPMQADTLQNTNKGRVKMSGKRRPPSRMARRIAAQESIDNETTGAEYPSPPLLKENSVPSALKYPSARLLPPARSSNHLHETYNTIKSTGHSDVSDFFDSSDVLEHNVSSKAASRPKATVETESHMSHASKDGGQLSVPVSLDDDLFQPKKPVKELSPSSFLEDEEDLFTTNKKTVKRKDLKPTSQSGQDPQVQDIFEGDIFASEAVKLPVKTKTLLEANLFDDDVDIFADLAVKPKEKSAKKKVEAKSIFDEDTDDIFSPSQFKTTQKTQSLQKTSGTKSEFKASNTFDDPLNAFEGQ
uniref:FAM21/CAPZIP domain-containing protein n=1 Tax=Anolis carolinensis TaxID=28377 RepID=H9GD12_ANOCA|nr:PREDICTED: WASH complex subunit FAM21C [Anolis carolinensis]|eukprot:XP_008115938.1 PREDICTED: WASH complex subunit FAM21C [Anolis carolinensis]